MSSARLFPVILWVVDRYAIRYLCTVLLGSVFSTIAVCNSLTNTFMNASVVPLRSHLLRYSVTCKVLSRAGFRDSQPVMSCTVTTGNLLYRSINTCRYQLRAVSL